MAERCVKGLRERYQGLFYAVVNCEQVMDILSDGFSAVRYGAICLSKHPDTEWQDGKALLVIDSFCFNWYDLYVVDAADDKFAYFGDIPKQFIRLQRVETDGFDSFFATGEEAENTEEPEESCPFCLNAYSDPDGELTPENDLSYLSVGKPASGYSMHIRTGDNRPTALVIGHFDESCGRTVDICVYEMKYCPECGRRLTENEVKE